jgi:hypothetical protein
VGFFGAIDFGGTIGVPLLSLDTIGTMDSNTAFWDNSGDMKVFSNGFNVYDSNLNVMPGCPLIYDSTYLAPPSTYGSSLPQGSIIMRMPNDASRCYLFHTSYKGPDSTSSLSYGKLYYSIIDLNMNNGLGAVTNVKNVLISDTTWTGYLNAVKHGNGRDWWLISGRNYSNIINTWLVQQDTISGPFSQPVGLWLNWPQALNQTQFSPNGDRLVISYFQYSGTVYNSILADFNRCTGIISNIQLLSINNDGSGNGVSGSEFSESGRFLYISSAFNMFQFDLLSANIQGSMLNVKVHDNLPSPFPSGFAFSKRGPDGRIYCSTGNGNYAIDVINYPDSLGTACDIQLRQINYFTQFGATYAMNIITMPNYPDYTLGPWAGSPCDTLTGVGSEQPDEVKIGVSPNPASETVTCSFPAQDKGGRMDMMDALGRVVFSEAVPPWSQYKNIDVRSLSPGLYLCKFQWSERGATVRILVE